jgi:hypothetical protein
MMSGVWCLHLLGAQSLFYVHEHFSTNGCLFYNTKKSDLRQNIVLLLFSVVIIQSSHYSVLPCISMMLSVYNANVPRCPQAIFSSGENIALVQ